MLMDPFSSFSRKERLDNVMVGRSGKMPDREKERERERERARERESSALSGKERFPTQFCHQALITLSVVCAGLPEAIYFPS
jgi:hypothetical protein